MYISRIHTRVLESDFNAYVNAPKTSAAFIGAGLFSILAMTGTSCALPCLCLVLGHRSTS